MQYFETINVINLWITWRKAFVINNFNLICLGRPKNEDAFSHNDLRPVHR
jgi:hypothetical protein